MTIGEKIKYFREKQDMTQAKLAELTGIHPVSIRKYETDKMEPKEPQIERIAEALNINTFALTGTDVPKVKYKTVGNVMGVLMYMINAGIIDLTWEEKCKGRPDYSTVRIVPTPFFQDFIMFKNGTQCTPIEDLTFKSSFEPALGDLLHWYQLNAQCKGNPEDENFRKLKEAQENWLQSDMLSFEEMLENGLEVHADEKTSIINKLEIE